MTIGSDSLDVRDATSLFQRLISKANTGHAEIPFPVGAYRAAAATGKLFPLELSMQNGHALITKNHSQNEDLKAGREVLQINGKSINDVIRKMNYQLSAETEYFKNAKMELWSFPRLYWQIYDQQESFDIEIRDDNGRPRAVSVDAVDLVEGYEMVRSDVFPRERSISYYDNAACIVPRDFSGDLEEFKVFVDTCFEQIREKDIDQLILDFRNNGGGDNALSDYLISYIADRPFQWNSKFLLKSSDVLKKHIRAHNDTTDTYYREILDQPSGKRFEYHNEEYLPQRRSQRFEGKVYVLVNRHSYSMATLAAAIIQDYGWGEVTGEPTGDFPSLHASIFSITLPNTGIQANVPKGYIVRPNGNTDAKGLQPDVVIKDDPVSDKDEILEGVLRIIKG